MPDDMLIAVRFQYNQILVINLATTFIKILQIMDFGERRGRGNCTMNSKRRLSKLSQKKLFVASVHSIN